MKRNKYYFASDFHLGIDGKLNSRDREKLLVKWLADIQEDAHSIFLVGDVWDFYFEYSKVVPKGTVRLMGKLAELTDMGIEIHFFKGNHDMWIDDYLSSELGIIMHSDEYITSINNKRFYIAHGDGLGPGDLGYKNLKKVFRSRWAQWLFSWIHPDVGIAMANFWSGKSRGKGASRDEVFHGKDEWLIQFCQDHLKTQNVDYFIFGHRHLPIDCDLKKARYINLGEWIYYQSYAVFDGEELRLLAYENQDFEAKIIEV